ncbi:MAG: hypothetical protein MN733_33650 [Nitrososphaera sp.]|nr:hypothetical protein [Nitrososphaera sp.]
MTTRRSGLITLMPLLFVAACTSPQPRLLPICNLKCVSGEQCTREHSVSSADIETLLGKLKGSFPLHNVDLVSVTSGYAVVLAKDEADNKLRDSWKVVGCFTSTMPPSNADYARLQQCVSGMLNWISFSNPSDAPALMLDTSYRRTCMNSTER